MEVENSSKRKETSIEGTNGETHSPLNHGAMGGRGFREHRKSEKRPNLDAFLNIWAMKKTGCFEFIGDDILPSYIEIMINHCKDPY